MNRPTLKSLLVALIGSAAIVGSCDSSTGSDDSDFDRPALLANVANNIISPAYGNFETEITELETAVAAFSSDPTETNLVAAQNALHEARLAWQDVNLFGFGPALSSALRTALNTYPTNTDKINANIVAGNNTLGTVANIDAGGFPALDYLLHGTGNTNTEIVEQFTTADNAANRLSYLTANVNFVVSEGSNVASQWEAGSGSYVSTFLSAENSGSDVGSSLGLMVNALTEHFERFIRDGKVGIPAGVRSAGIARPTTTEAFYSGRSRELAAANLRSVLRLFLGSSISGVDGIGLAENLEALGNSELSTSIQTELNEAINVVQGLSDPLSENITNDPDAVLNAFAELQELVVLLKADLASSLGISITGQDNDGD